MKRNIFKTILLSACILQGGSALAQQEKAEPGKFSPTWESLSQYEVPEWFRNAKFGIWAHWGPQCQPEAGDWYGRGMYEEGGAAYKWHLEHYGHPSEFGFKDVINEWKAEKWNPERLVALFKKTGARYFFAMGNHHDNMDLWDSKYQSWNSVNMGPKRNVLGEWEKAARKNKLPFGVSIHSSHAWTWYETAQGADKKGPYAGISYDARVVTKEDGKGKWWEGYDPQELYVQNHALSGHAWAAWDWPEGTSVPPQSYYDNFFDRTVDMINKYHPDLVYFDDSVLPFWPINDTGLKVVSHYYNQNMKLHKGNLNAVVFGKKLEAKHKEAIVWDVEKGVPSECQDKAWQTCSCLGTWHYNRSAYEDNWYKSAETVIHMLIDIVSKNGNLLLSVPMKGNGTIDDKEEKILEDIAARSLSQRIQCFLELVVRAVIQETQGTSAGSSVVNHFGHHGIIVTKIKLVTDTDLTGRIYQHIPQAKFLIQLAQQKYLDTGTGLFLISIQTRRENFRIIKDKHIFIIKIVQDILEYLVFNLTC